MKMRTSILTLIMMFLGAMTMVSCLSDSTSSSTQTSGHCAITNVVLGGMNRTIYTKSPNTGNDTSYVVTVAAGSYPMYIDQKALVIYNPDSLPHNTNPKKVIFSKFEADGTMYYRTASGNDTIYNEKDSLDFSTPRYFTCCSSDGNQKKTYLIHVNVHQSVSEDFSWTEVCEAASAFEGVSEQKAFANNGVITIIGVKDGKPVVITNSTEAPEKWTVTEATGLVALKPLEVQQYEGTYYVVDGTLKQSADGKTWSEVSTNISLDRLFAIGINEAHAYAKGKLYSSSDMQIWTEEALDSEASTLPVSGLVSVCSAMKFNNNFSTIIVAGKDASDENVIWRYTADITGTNSDPWEDFPVADETVYAYPALEQSVMLNYDSKVYYLGLNGENICNFVVCSDGGRNWIAQTEDGYSHPYTDVKAESFSAVVDENDFFWIMFAPSGKVVKGRLNRLSYESNQTTFLKGIK